MLRSVTPCCATEICKSVSEGHTHWQNTWKLKVVRFAYFLPDRIFIFVSSLKSQPLQQVTFPILTALLYGIVTNWIPTKLMFSRLWSAVRCSSDYCNVYLSTWADTNLRLTVLEISDGKRQLPPIMQPKMKLSKAIFCRPRFFGITFFIRLILLKALLLYFIGMKYSSKAVELWLSLVARSCVYREFYKVTSANI